MVVVAAANPSMLTLAAPIAEPFDDVMRPVTTSASCARRGVTLASSASDTTVSAASERLRICLLPETMGHHTRDAASPHRLGSRHRRVNFARYGGPTHQR